MHPVGFVNIPKISLATIESELREKLSKYGTIKHISITVPYCVVIFSTSTNDLKKAIPPGTGSGIFIGGNEIQRINA